MPHPPRAEGGAAGVGPAGGGRAAAGPPAPGGAAGPRPAALLTDEQAERVHEASLEILEQVGVLVRHPRARAILLRHGGRAVGEIVRLPPGLVAAALASAGRTFTFRGRAPETDRRLPDDAPVVVTGSSAPDLVDPATGGVRRARAADIARIARLIDALPGYDVLSVPVLADDAPPGRLTVARLYPALRHCRKPLRISGPAGELGDVLRLAWDVAGGEAAYRERPFVTHHYCPVISPLALDVDSTETLLACAEQGWPGYASVVPNGGLTAPLGLLGTLTQGNAEFLAVTVLEQAVAPGRPALYSSLPTIADMRTGAYAPGAVETGILLMGVAQLARRYGVPGGGYVGLTNAKTHDAQAGWETGLSAAAAVLGGAHLLNTGGLLDALLVFDFGKARADGEIALMLKRLARGVPADDDPGREVVAEVGPGGFFGATRHSRARVRTAALLTEIADRTPRQAWLAAGAPDAHARALARATDLLRGDAPGLFSPEVEARLRAAWPDLAGGEPAPAVPGPGPAAAPGTPGS